MSCDANDRSASGSCSDVSSRSTSPSNRPPSSRNAGFRLASRETLAFFAAIAAFRVRVAPEGHDGRHNSCGLQLEACFLSCARSSIAAVARSSRMPPSALPQSTRTCADSMYATSTPSSATATSAKYQRMTNASVVHSKNPARPTDQWKYRQVGRHDGALVSPSAKVERLSAAYAERKQMLSRGATRSSDPIMDAHRQNTTVKRSAAIGSPLSSTNAARARNGTVPSTAMALSTLGALIRHCSACDSDAMMIPICVGNASGQAISLTTPMESPPPPASRLRRYDEDAPYTAEGPPLRYSRSATAPHMIMYDAYMASEIVIAASVPHGMLVAGDFSELARFAPDRMPVKHGKNTESTSENVTPSV